MAVVLLLGVVSGMILANVLYAGNPAKLQAFLLEPYYSQAIVTYRYKKTALYILPQRLIQLAFVSIVTYLLSGIGIYYFWMCGIGALWGFLAGLELLYDGIQGLFMAAICIIPHGLFYCLMIYYAWNQKREREKLKIPAVLLLLVLALVMETVLEPQFLRFFH